MRAKPKRRWHRQPAKELTDKVSSEHLHVVIVADNVCPDVAGITTIEETHRQLAQVIDHFQTTIATNVVAVFIGYKVCLLLMSQRQTREIRSIRARPTYVHEVERCAGILQRFEYLPHHEQHCPIRCATKKVLRNRPAYQRTQATGCPIVAELSI